MSRIDPVTPGAGLMLRKTGEFDLDALYSDMHLFFNENSYVFQELENGAKTKDRGEEITIKWKGERTVDTYAKFIINVSFVIENAKKRGKTYTGDLVLTLSASVELDYKNEWPLKPMGNFLFKIYNKYIIKQKLGDKYYGPLFSEVNSLHERAKRILEFYP